VSARAQDTTRSAEVAARCSFRPSAAGTRGPLEIEATTGHELAQPECRPVAKVALRRAMRAIGLRGVESHEPESLAGYADRVAVQHLDFAGLNWSSTRASGDEG
jgi:hypothetical protein